MNPLTIYFIAYSISCICMLIFEKQFHKETDHKIQPPRLCFCYTFMQFIIVRHIPAYNNRLLFYPENYI